jgi:hypothetical protein
MPVAAARPSSSTRASSSSAIYSCVLESPGRNAGAFFVSSGLEPPEVLSNVASLMNVPRLCEEKDQLRKVYTVALDELIEATTTLRRAQYGPEFLDALNKTQKVRTTYENARRALEDHRKAHGC